MKRLSLAVTAALSTFALAAVAGVTQVQPDTPVPVAAEGAAMIDETPSHWFVELSGAPVAEGASLASVRNEKQAFRAAARGAGLRFTERYAYDTLFNGFSIAMPASGLGKLSRLPGVKAIYAVDTIALPEFTEDARIELENALAMTGADIAQSALGLDGTGIRVAVMDTGIDIDHPDFGGSGVDGTTPFPTARIVAGWDFVGDAFDANPGNPTYNPVPVPDPIPDDCGGHGTHVAGIVGANGGVKGVAPNVTFGAYRVFGCEGSTTADIMLAAMEMAHADGMHILNMSIGAAFQWPEYPTAKAASRLVERGMVVVASIGNSGASGLYAGSAPGVGERVIGVASYNNTHLSQPAFSISPDDRKVGYNLATAAPLPPASGTEPMARTGTVASLDDACNPLPADSLADKIALIRRGTCAFHVKALNAQNAGASGVVLYNNVAGALNPTVAGTPAITIPVVAISAADGALIDGRLASGAVDLTWGAGTVTTPDPAGGLIASSSSYGMAPNLDLKPDIGAPGGNIYSTYPLEQGGYRSISGTSMSAPHVAGAAALLLQAAPGTDTRQVRTMLQNTASPKPWWGNPALGFLDNVHRQGAGMLQIDKAIAATSAVSPGKLSLGEGEAGASSHNLQIVNNNRHAVTYTLGHVNALSTGFNSFTPSFFVSDAQVRFNRDSVRIPGKGKAIVRATVEPATTPEGGLYGGYITITPDDGSDVLRVPYAGYIGDYQARQVLVPTGNGFPWLARLTGGTYFNQPGGATYSLADGDIPYFLVHLDHPVRLMKLEVFDADSGKWWYSAYESEYLPRNSTATGFFAFTWDGNTTQGKGGNVFVVPDGNYVVKLSVLKALGDMSNPDHWETWTSPTITIQRP